MPMDILFKSRKIWGLCHDDTLATRTLGPESAHKLRARLDDLVALPNLSLARRLPGRFHPLSRDRAGQYALDLHGGNRLVLEPAGDSIATLPDGSRNLASVTAIRIVLIGDYHD